MCTASPLSLAVRTSYFMLTTYSVVQVKISSAACTVVGLVVTDCQDGSWETRRKLW